MKIIKLVSENVKMLKAVEIVPDEHFQIISGRNEQGKSSVLDSIWYALGGAKAMEDLDEPVRRGQDKAFVSVDLGDITVTRKWRAEGTTVLEVWSKDGKKYGSPQKFLDSLIGRLSFDPLAFAQLDDKKQVATLQDLVGYNPAELDAERTLFYDQRTLVNREVDSFKGQLDGIPLPTVATPDEEVSAASIIAELQEAQEQQRRNDAVRKSYHQVLDKIGSYQEQVERLNREIERLTEKRDALVVEWDAAEVEQLGKEAAVEALVDPDLDVFQTRLTDLEKTNQRVREKKRRAEVAKQLADAEARSLKLTEQIAEIDRKKKEQLQKTVFPIEGLGFGDHGLTFGDIPFKQCSSAQRLKVSMAMAMALNPHLRVIRILNGNLLDSGNLAVIREMAQEKDYQIFVELVDESGSVGITIEDGRVVANDTLPA